MGQIEKTFEYTRTIEEILTQSFGAQGKGLHQEVTSVRRKLTEPLIKKLRYIASVRNQMMHHKYNLDEPEAFYATCEQTIRMLNERLAELKRNPPRAAIPLQYVAAGAVVLAVASIIALRWFKAGTSEAPGRSEHASSSVQARASIPPQPDQVAYAEPSTGAAPGKSEAVRAEAMPVRQQARAARPVPRQRVVDGRPTQVVSLVSNGLITFSHGTLSKTSDFFTGTAFVVRGTVTNVGQHGLMYIDTRAAVYVPRAGRWIGGISQLILLPHKGLGPGQSARVSVTLGGSFASDALAVPDVEDSPGLKVRLQVIDGTDRMGDMLSSTGTVMMQNGG